MAMLLGSGSLHSTPGRARVHDCRGGCGRHNRTHARDAAHLQDGGRRHRYSGFTGMQMSHSKTPVCGSYFAPTG